jgi:hypothetical protein
MARSGGDPAPHPSVVTLPLQDLPSADTVFDRIGRSLGNILGLFASDEAAPEAAGFSAETLRGQAQQRDDFVALMETAGYGLREIETSIGLVPSSRMTFGPARELTDADRDHIERQLERHAQRQGGPLSRVQRAIVGSVIAASELGELSVDRVEIELFPLPQIRMALVPRDAPMSLEAGRLMRSIERLGERLHAPQGLHGETELQMRRRDPQMRAVGLNVQH